jgi:predicted SnoaL-like aldol condensation-catalyzing enzyme
MFSFLLMAASGHAYSSEDANRKIVVDFYTKAFGEAKVREAAERFIDEKTYIQHNPNVGNGRKAFIDFFEPYFAKQKGRMPSEIKRVVTEGALVVLHVHSRRDASDPGDAVIDIFRVASGKIVEHWDVRQQIPVKSANGNTMF